jgi:hypothetical protein
LVHEEVVFLFYQIGIRENGEEDRKGESRNGEGLMGEKTDHAVHEAAETPEGIGVVLEDSIDYAE